MIINSVIFFDLYLVIKNPFVNRGSRMKWYVLYIGISITVEIYLEYLLNPSIADQITNQKIDKQGIIMFSYFGLVSFPAFVNVIRRLSMKSTSRDLKMKILRRHILYFIIYAFFIAQTIMMYTIPYF